MLHLLGSGVLSLSLSLSAVQIGSSQAGLCDRPLKSSSLFKAQQCSLSLSLSAVQGDKCARTRPSMSAASGNPTTRASRRACSTSHTHLIA
mmetsp:Transcript_61975/g.164369  ORF Transcript_61975/g.164369 Transcript_61975/m.164369 type:complete len:91 (-) Transcript_61975:155-427(-)